MQFVIILILLKVVLLNFQNILKFFNVDYGKLRCYDWCVTDKGALIKIDNF